MNIDNNMIIKWKVAGSSSKVYLCSVVIKLKVCAFPKKKTKKCSISHAADDSQRYHAVQQKRLNKFQQQLHFVSFTKKSMALASLAVV